MQKNRPAMMLLTGLILALLLFALVSLTQTSKTPPLTNAKPLTPAQLNNEHRVMPARVLSAQQNGNTIMLTGTGVSGAGLSLMNDMQILTTTKLSADGEWATEVSFPIMPKKMTISLSMDTPDGQSVRSEQSIVIATLSKDIGDVNRSETSIDGLVNTPQNVTRALIMVCTPGANSRVLQTPFDTLPTKNGFVLETIDYDNSGGVIFSGTSSRKGMVRVYANNNLVGGSGVDGNGRWSLIFGNIMPMGTYDIAIELVSEDLGEPIRLDMPFERMTPITNDADVPSIVVQYTDDKIQIGRKLYGGGYQFSVVYAPIILIK